MVTPLKDYINESLQDLLKDEKDWMKISSKEYGIYISDKPELYEMIPYKELNLNTPECILIVFKKEGPRWVSIIKWISKFDKQVYVCNGWKYGEYDINDLKIKIHEIIEHLSKSSAARKEFKEVMIKFINILKDSPEYEGKPIDAFMKYDSIISINSLEDLLKIK